MKKKNQEEYTILVTADIHMSNNLPYSVLSENGKTDRLDDQIKLLDEICDKAESCEVDAIFILGDLFDKSTIDPITLTHTVKAILALPCDVYILPGNHDSSFVKGGGSLIEALSIMSSHVHDLSALFHLSVNDWLTFWSIPFSSNDVAIQKIKRAKSCLSKTEQTNVLLLHQNIIGCNYSNCICKVGLDADFVCEDFDHVLAGHFHRNQLIGDSKIYGIHMYVGSPMQHDFGDVENNNLFWKINFWRNGECKITPFESDSPKFYKQRLNTDLEKLSTFDYVGRGNYLRYEVYVTPYQWIKIKPQMEKLLVSFTKRGVIASVKYVPIKESKLRLDFDKNEDSVAVNSMEHFIEKYVDFCAWKGDNRDEILQTGLKILNEAYNV